MFHPDADIFFEDPRNDPNPSRTYGILYLLRRDIWFSFGLDPTTNRETTRTLWLGGMGILAGIDLLGKFHEGDDNSHKVGPRFRRFVKEYFRPLPPGDEETIYQLRNSLLHSFGLYSYSEKTNQDYHFVLTEKGLDLVKNIPSDIYVINLCILHRRFEEAVLKYAEDVEGNVTLQGNFQKMFGKYGTMKRVYI